MLNSALINPAISSDRRKKAQILGLAFFAACTLVAFPAIVRADAAPFEPPEPAPSPTEQPAPAASPSAVQDPASTGAPTGASTGAASGETPDQALLRDLNLIKEKKSMLAIVDEVDWDTALTLFPVDKHNTIINMPKIETADDLRNYFLEIFGDPKMRSEKTKGRMKAAAMRNGLKTDNVDDSMTVLETAFARAQLTIQSAIQMSTFKIGDVKVEEPKAYIQLFTTRTGITTVKDVTMVKKDGRWLLAEPSLVGMRGQKIIAPAGNLPEHLPGLVGPSIKKDVPPPSWLPPGSNTM